MNENQRTEYGRILNANIKLVDKVSEMERDMYILINYINGNKELENQAKEIMEYYKDIKVKG